MTRNQQPKEEAAATKKRGSDEIDSIFSAKRKKKAAVEDKRKKQSGPSSYHKGNRSNLQAAFSKPSSKDEWVDDGLGGRFNGEGYTGRVEDGVKVFKAHVLNRPDAGSTKDCPFDCDCCFI